MTTARKETGAFKGKPKVQSASDYAVEWKAELSSLFPKNVAIAEAQKGRPTNGAQMGRGPEKKIGREVPVGGSVAIRENGKANR